MRKPGKRLGLLFAMLFMGVVLVFIPRFVSASLLPQNPLPTAIPPEPYPNSDIYPAVIYLETAHDLQVLYDQKVDIDDLKTADGAQDPTGSTFKPSIATVYINPAQSEALTLAGLSPVSIPNEGYRSFLAHGPGTKEPPGWPTFEEYVARMQNLEASHPDIVKLLQIGLSVQNRGLYCMEITDNPGMDEYEPEFKYTAAHHGDETTGIEMTMRLAELLANNYGIDPMITDMVDKMEIWLCPIYNPDGYVNGTRYNAHGADLNRDFPDRFTDPIDDPAGREPETQAFMNFGYAHRFVMGANYHGGEQVLNYPFDAVADPYNPINAPDDQLFYDFGLGYTSRNPDLWDNPYFEHGITRGWEWYMIYGGMQDWSYYYHGEHHVTLEISWDKNPAFNLMDGFWDRNRDAMLWWMQRVWTGIDGLVLDARDSTPISAILTLVGRDIPNTILTDPQVGDYHRVISAGSYTLEASADGYLTKSYDVTVYSGTLTTQDFYLDPIPYLSPSTKLASSTEVLPEDMVQFQLHVENLGLTSPVLVTDTLPISLTWTGDLTATQGIPSFEAGQILWQGDVAPGEPVTITYGVTVNQCLPGGSTILNIAQFDDGITGIITGEVQLEVGDDAPSVPTSPSPVDGAVQLPITTTLSWMPSTDLNCDQIEYRIAFGTDTLPPILPYDLTTPSYDPGLLSSKTKYYWQVTAMDGENSIVGPLWSFTTARGLERKFLPLATKSGP